LWIPSAEGLDDGIIPGQLASEIIAGICLCCVNLKDLDIYKSPLKIDSGLTLSIAYVSKENAMFF